MGFNSAFKGLIDAKQPPIILEKLNNPLQEKNSLDSILLTGNISVHACERQKKSSSLYHHHHYHSSRVRLR